MSKQYPLSGKIAVVTGASSGIGKAIANILAKSGATVGLGARRKEVLDEVVKEINEGVKENECPGIAVGVVTDVCQGEQVKSLVKQTEVCGNSRLGTEGGTVDIMINCAGVMFFTLMKNVKEDEWQKTVDVNCKGVMNGVGAVLDSMVKKGSGHIVNISSDASKRTFPCLAVYCASKAFVDVMSEGLRRELIGTGVRVTVLQPGDVKTNLVMNNTDQEAAEKMGVKIGQPVGEGWGNEYNLLEPKDVADAVLYAVTAPPHVAINEVLIEPRDQA